MSGRHDIWKLLDAIQMDLRAASAKMVELRARVSALELGDKHEVRCPHAGCAIPFPGRLSLAEHLYTSHSGPVPEHWEEIERRSLEPQEEVEA